MRRGAFGFTVRVHRPYHLEKKIQGFTVGGKFWKEVSSVYANVARTMVKLAREAAPEFTGELKRSIRADVDKSGYSSEIAFVAEAPYAAAVEEGSKPHATVSKRVAIWAEAKGYLPWVMYRTIRLLGTRKHPFFYQARDIGADKMLRRLGAVLNGYMRG